jgi:hypothetical protein
MSCSDGSVANNAPAQHTSEQSTRNAFNNMVQAAASMPPPADEVAWLRPAPTGSLYRCIISSGLWQRVRSKRKEVHDSTDM